MVTVKDLQAQENKVQAEAKRVKVRLKKARMQVEANLGKRLIDLVAIEKNMSRDAKVELAELVLVSLVNEIKQRAEKLHGGDVEKDEPSGVDYRHDEDEPSGVDHRDDGDGQTYSYSEYV